MIVFNSKFSSSSADFGIIAGLFILIFLLLLTYTLVYMSSRYVIKSITLFLNMIFEFYFNSVKNIKTNFRYNKRIKSKGVRKKNSPWPSKRVSKIDAKIEQMSEF